ncbi:KICSTOR complex protein ITFG2 isoform X2 [Scleropages formosus]|uniref:KICSTOR complex protein ITFG2 isoform X2 n=1 Tax=Scleropages formosus TaxID=113540 RepID=UPI00087890B1|nr:KICSTOR complex protein ITFG2 isoform X2 [Scleropages formosus]
MRSVSYVQRVSLDFPGSLFPHAICLGDVDNDSLNELVVGDTSGKLHVYKSEESKPWLSRTCVGMVTCVGVGDVCNRGKNLTVAVGAEGWFHLFDLTTSATKLDSSSQQEVQFWDDQKPLFTQHIPANTKVILISDIDGDGRNELVVGYADRVVRAFRWEEPVEATEVGSGQLVLLKKWLLEGQVDSLSVNVGPGGTPELMVSQPGCGYAILLCSWAEESAGKPEECDPGILRSEGPPRDIVLHLTSGRIHNKNVSTHLIGSISRGTLKLMDSTEKLLWSVQVDHQLFALQKLDVTGDGQEEVVACAWDGQTYIIDHNRTVVRFQFEENVNAFCAGQYACKDGKNSPCLVYVSFNHKIYVYWRVQLECMKSTNLLKVLEERPEYRTLLQCLSVDADDLQAMRQLIRDVLYKDLLFVSK